MRIKEKTALSFDDVLLIPQHSNITSRKDPDTSTRLSKKITLKIPIISSCMDSVTGPHMAICMWRAGGLGILHRYNTIEQQVSMFKAVNSVYVDEKTLANCAVAIGMTGDYFERATELYNAGVTIFCIDVAHGDCEQMKVALTQLRKAFGDTITIIAGNVATGEGCVNLLNHGADAIRAGIGGGSLCTTRLVTGHGVPTFQTIVDCKRHLDSIGYKDYCLIADGGIKNSGDIVKSIAAGAGCVILGQMLAATDESPGDIIDENGQKFKKYRGMASMSAQIDWKPGKQEEIVPEGECTILPYKGSTNKILYNLVGGLRSGMTYSNARNLIELEQNAEFVSITTAGWAESKPHAKTK